MTLVNRARFLRAKGILAVVISLVALVMVLPSGSVADSGSPAQLISDAVLDGTTTPVDGLPTNLPVPTDIWAVRKDAQGNPDQAMIGALHDLETQAVQDTIADHQLAPSDTVAAQTWGRTAAIDELWGILLQAAQTPAGDRTQDQSLAVAWLQSVFDKEAEIQAYYAGLEYTDYIGNQVVGFNNGQPVFIGLTESAYNQYVANKDWPGLQSYLEQSLNGDGSFDSHNYCEFQSPSNDTQDVYVPPSPDICGTNCASPEACDDVPTIQDFVTWGTDLGYGALISDPNVVAAIQAQSEEFPYGLAVGRALPSGTLTGPVYTDGATSAAVATSLSGVYSRVSDAGAYAADAVSHGIDVAGTVVSGLLTALEAETPGIDVPFFLASAAIDLYVAITDDIADSQVPDELVALLKNALGQNVSDLASSGDGQAALYSMFLASTMPQPEETCTAGSCSCPTAAKECLNAPPPVASDESDTPFQLQAGDGSIAPQQTDQFTFYDVPSHTVHVVYSRDGWFVDTSTAPGGQTVTIQSLSITYTDWDGREQTAWIVPTPGGGHQFVIDDHQSDVVTPGFCPVGGHCGVAGQIFYQDELGHHLEALLNYGDGSPPVSACSGTCGTSSATTTTLSWDPATGMADHALTLSATVARSCEAGPSCPTPTGAVSFAADENGIDTPVCAPVALTNGGASCVWSSPVAGVVFATYVPSDSSQPAVTGGTAGSQADADVQVVEDDFIPVTTTSLSLSPASVGEGTFATATVTNAYGTPGRLSGRVALTTPGPHGPKTLCVMRVQTASGDQSGTATCTTGAFTSAGNHAVDAMFLSDAPAPSGFVYSFDSLASATIDVAPGQTQLGILPVPPMVAGDATDVHVTVSADGVPSSAITGSLAVFDAGDSSNTSTCAVSDGAGTCSFTPSSAGSLTLEAVFTYTGDPQYGDLSKGATASETVYGRTVTVAVSGTELAGGKPSFSRVVSGGPPDSIGVTGSLTCADESGGQSLSSLSAGTYTVAGTSCSGLTPTLGGSTTNLFQVAYVGVAGGFDVYPDTAGSYIVDVTGTQVYSGQPTFAYTVDHTPGGTPATLAGEGLLIDGSKTGESASWSTCSAGNPATQTFSANGHLGDSPYSLVSGSGAYQPGTFTENGSVSFDPGNEFTVTGFDATFSATTTAGAKLTGTLSLDQPVADGGGDYARCNASGYVYLDYTTTITSPGGAPCTASGHASLDFDPTDGQDFYEAFYDSGALACGDLTGSVTCTGYDGGTNNLDSSVSVNNDNNQYKLTGPSCSGLSDPEGAPIQYDGDGFTVTPEPVTATVTGSQAYGGGSLRFFATTSPNVESGAVTCLTVDGSTPIAPDLDVAGGPYTIDGESGCSGLSNPAGNFTFTYGGQFTVLPLTVTVTPSGSQTYGQTPSFDYSTSPAGVELGGTLWCTTVGGTAITPTTAPLTDGQLGGCSGLSQAQRDYTVQYAPGEFVVGQDPLNVVVTGVETAGGEPIFSYSTSQTLADGTSLSGTLTCATADGAQSLPSLAPGVHTLDSSSCSGLVGKPNDGYAITYVGSTFTVNPVPTVTPATVPQTVVGVPWSASFKVSGGTPPYEIDTTPVSDVFNAEGTGITPTITWDPATATETISGTPTSTGQAIFDIRGQDASGIPIYLINVTLNVVTASATTLSSQASAGVPLGGQVTDTATLSGGVSPTGTITFTLYGPNPTTCTGTPVATSTATVTGNGGYTSAAATPATAGTYEWVVSYGGDATNAAAGPTSCTDPKEAVTVGSLTPTLVTSAAQGTGAPGESVTDNATVSGSGAIPTGSVTFFVCNPATVGTNGGDCHTGGSQVGSAITLDGSGKATSAATTSTATSGAYCWRAVYSGDGAYAAVTESSAATECFTVSSQAAAVATTAAPTGGGIVPGSSASDSATVSGGGSSPTGTVTFYLCDPATVTGNGGDCRSGGTKIGSAGLDASGKASSPSTTATTAVGTYCWRAEYSGDGTYGSASHTNSGTECFTTVTQTPTLTTSSSPAGLSPTDSATVTGAGPVPTGNVTFFLCDPPTVSGDGGSCASGGTQVGTATALDGTGKATSAAASGIGKIGTWCWRAEYAGDTIYRAATDGGAAGECFTLGKQPSAVTTQTHATGTAATDAATVSGGGPTPTGTVTFFLCNPATVTSNGGSCSSGGSEIGTPVPLDGSGKAASNASTITAADGTYCWRAEYSGDGFYTASTDSAGASECFTPTKQAATLSTSAAPSDATEVPGVSASDAATVTGGGPAPGGTVTFYLCNPSTVVADGGSCASGGTQVGSPVTLDATGKAGSASTTATGTVGTYCWRAVYSGDGYYNTATDPGPTGECFTTVKQAPAVSTAAGPGGSAVVPGTSETDTASVSGGAGTPTGTVTFYLCDPATVIAGGGSCSTGGTQVGTAASLDGNGNATSTATAATTSIGTYCWRAVYSGDGIYQSASDTAASGECFTTVLQPATLTSSSAPTGGGVVPGTSAADSAKVSGGGPAPTGTVTFYLCGPDTANNGCSAGIEVGSGVMLDSGGGATSAATTATTAIGTYCWRAAYSGDGYYKAVSATDGSGECFTTVRQSSSISTQASPTGGGAVPGAAATDTATVTGAGPRPSGLVTFYLCKLAPAVPTGAGCSSGGSQVGDPVALDGNGQATSASTTATVGIGTWCWRAVYGGDTDHTGSTDAGGSAECFTTVKQAATVATQSSSTSTTLPQGTAVSDSALVSGDSVTPSGTVTFYLCNPGQVTSHGCPAGGKQVGNPVALDGSGRATSSASTDTHGLGTYCWRAVYSGDAIYNGATDAATTGECFTVAQQRTGADLAITGTATPNPVVVNHDLTLHLTITNNGPETATRTIATDTLPATVAYVSSNPGPSGCTFAPRNQTVTCDLGNLVNGARAAVTIKVKPSTTGIITDNVSVTSQAPDPSSANNTASIAITVKT